ncbi:tyrosine-type recombinase/integrase [Cerasicoccus frondis]|uniref:tyrosine-type recombinase/integrase n=1 Tax=Cerasicoccus frondis TaxID=490090 RepID=UPI0028529728|nr:tyrosine-type recombinase/integrase [Cerasicoccus frondis]
MSKNYVRRGDWYHYFRRVPKHVATYDDRTHVRIALKTKSVKEATRIAAVYDAFVERYWGDLIRSGQPDARGDRFKRAVALAKANGFAYKNMADLVDGPLDDLIARLEVADGNRSEVVRAVLGNEKASTIRLSKCIERYWPLCSDRLVGKNEQQVRKFKNPRAAALKNFIKVVGDIDLSEVQRKHALEFRNWLLARIADVELVGNSANKQLTFAKDIMLTVGRDLEIPTDFKVVFAETNVKQTTVPRPPFEAGWAQDKFINEDKLAGMNEAARMLAYMMIETGARESELIGLEAQDFFLDADVPHIWIRKNGLRDLKTPQSDRRIPLVGISLMAAQQVYPDGFSRYHTHPESASAAANKYLKENNLRPTPRHTLYSLRHTFKDRLRDAGAPEEVIQELMGHRKHGPQYGRGHTLETKLKWLEQIAFNAPLKI